jgi:hypothetical protein
VAIDANVPGSPEWWLLRLGKRLRDNSAGLNVLRNYYIGAHPLPEGDAKIREAYQRFQRKARSNYTGLVVESVRERLRVVGFRTGGQGTNATDQDAWHDWQANKMDARSIIVHRQALIYGRGYTIVGPPKDVDEDRDGDLGVPIITPEDPRFVIHESDPADPDDIRAALKIWYDDLDRRYHAVLYLPESVNYFQSANQGDQQSQVDWTVRTFWDWDITETIPDAQVANSIRVVPVVPFLNRPLGEPGDYGTSEFLDVIDIQDRINLTLLDRMVISKMQAYRQRWAKGIQLENEDGTPTEPFIPGVDLLWAVEDETAAFGEFSASDLAPQLAAVMADVRDLAAISRTPPHYLLGQMINVSGDALTAAETGLVAKTQDRMVQFGEAWESVNRLAGLWTGRTVPVDAEVIWADPQFRSMAQLADASVKFGVAGVPWRSRMEMLQKTPAEIDRMEAERASDALLAAQLAPLQAAVAPSVSPDPPEPATPAPAV